MTPWCGILLLRRGTQDSHRGTDTDSRVRAMRSGKHVFINAMPTRVRLNIWRIDGNDNQFTDTRAPRRAMCVARDVMTWLRKSEWRVRILKQSAKKSYVICCQSPSSIVRQRTAERDHNNQHFQNIPDFWGGPSCQNDREYRKRPRNGSPNLESIATLSSWFVLVIMFIRRKPHLELTNVFFFTTFESAIWTKFQHLLQSDEQKL